MKKKRINLTIDDEVYKDFKKVAVDLDISMSQLLEDLARDFIKKHTNKN